MKLTKLFLFLASTSALVISSAGSALAADPTKADLAVSATVVANCVISTKPVAFVGYDPIVANKTIALAAQGAVTLTCTKGAAVKISLDGVLHAAGGLNYMAGGGTTPSTLQYNLLQPDNSTPWTIASKYTVAVGDDGSHDYTVNGVIPAGQHVAPGTDYADTVQAQFNF